MRKGIITIVYEDRFVDRVVKAMGKMRLFKTDGYYPITEVSTGKEVARFVCIYGFGPIVRFLSWITDIRGKGTHEVEVDY